jgi:hypothetical protein
LFIFDGHAPRERSSQPSASRCVKIALRHAAPRFFVRDAEGCAVLGRDA